MAKLTIQSHGAIVVQGGNRLSLQSGNSINLYQSGLISGIGAEVDPVFTASPAASITLQLIANWDTAYGWGDHALAGYLTSVPPQTIGITVPTGLSGTSAPGSITIALADGYTIPTIAQLNTYLTAETDPVFSASPSAGITSDLINQWSTAYGWGNHATQGYLKTFTESDPIFTASAASSVTSTLISQWSTAYSWGNHATAGYLTSFTEADPIFTASAAAGITSGNITTWNAKEPPIAAGTTGQYWRGDKSWQTLDKVAVGLGNVDNTSDLNKPVSTATQTALDLKVNASSLATVATSGSYLDLSNKPTIPSAQVNSDWNANSGVTQILNKPTLATVATSGSYLDLLNKPTIPTFTSQLTNDTNYITSSQSPVQSVAGKTGSVTLTKSDVGLGNVDNTSDANKPISAATQTALNLKQNILTFSTGLTNTANTITVNTSQNIATLSNLTTNGFVKTSGGIGTLTIDTTAYLNKAGDTLSPADGTGFLGFPNQSAPPAPPGSGFRLYSDSSGRLTWVGQDAFTRSLDGVGNTANRIYTLPDKDGTIALTSDTTIAVSTPTGLSATSGVGTIVLSYASGYAIPTTAKQSTWDGKQDALGFTPLNRASNLSDLANATTARTNLGLGSLATQSGTFSGTSSGTNTGDVTIGTGNGLSLSGQSLSLQSASSTQNGALSSTDWTTFNSKQSALGFTPLNKAGDTLSPADGTGFLGYPSQSSSPSTPASGFRLFANSSNALAWRGQNSYLRVFDGTANTADRTYTLPDKSGTIALLSDVQVVTSTPPSPASYSDGQLWFKPTDNGVPGSAGLWINRSQLYWLSANLFEITYDPQTRTNTQINTAIQGASAALLVGSVSDTIRSPRTLRDLVWADSWSLFTYPASDWSGVTLNSSNSFTMYPGLVAATSETRLISGSVNVTAGSQILNPLSSGLPTAKSSGYSIGTTIDLTQFSNPGFRPVLLTKVLAGTPSFNISCYFGVSIFFRRIHP